MTPVSRIVSAGLAAFALCAATAAQAEVYRATVIVPAPPQSGSALAWTMRVDAAAQGALVERYITEKISPALLEQRGEDIRGALEPVGAMLGGFRAVTHVALTDGTVRVVCEADVDTGDVVRRLVSGGVLSFEHSSPRLLIVPGPGSSPEVVRALRVSMSETLSGSGITVLANEAIRSAADAAKFGHGADPGVVRQAAIDAGAHFVAVVRVNAIRAPSAVGGAVLDTTIEYTLMRYYDAAILGEKALTARGSGVSPEMAMQHILAELSPAMARSLAGHLTQALFANGRTLEEFQVPGPVVINVRRRPNPAATTALLSFLTAHGLEAALATGRQSALDSVPVEGIAVSGDHTVEEIYNLFAEGKFGPSAELSAWVFEHGTNTLGIEILDGRTPPKAERIELIVRSKVTAESTTHTGRGAPGPGEPKELRPGQPPPTAVVPPPTQKIEIAGGAQVTSRTDGSGTRKTATIGAGLRASSPVIFEFNEAMLQAKGAGLVKVSK